ncbi:hypothetical protein DWW90_17765 [Parabacteroides sp. AF17-28]|nr:hypothetical protein DWW90_17765 [Parabacteroides sp. AF17-28]
MSIETKVNTSVEAGAGTHVETEADSYIEAEVDRKKLRVSAYNSFDPSTSFSNVNKIIFSVTIIF